MKRTTLLLLIITLCTSLLAKDKIKVACVGNSITYGYTLPDREKNAYPFQLQNLLGSKYQIGNFGNSGATLLRKGHRPYNTLPEYKAALDFKADYVIIHLGLNDTDPRNWPNYKDEFSQDYLDLINSFRAVNPQVKIWICKMSPITYKHGRFKSGTRDWYRQIQSKIEQIAETAKVGLIDLQENLYSRTDLLPDALHPNVEGASIIAKQVYSTLSGDYGGLQMSEIYSDNMVLQRNRNLEITGIANANDVVTIEIAGKKLSTKTANNGKWNITLNPLRVATNLKLKIYSKTKTLEYKNVAVGEVWLCSGQSNMEFKLKQSNKPERAKTNNNIRLFDMRARWLTNDIQWDISALDSINKLKYYKNASWEISKKKTAMEFSAVAYYFGEMLADSLNIPIGLIHNSVGGSPTESWIDRATLEEQLPDIYSNWSNNDFVMPWVRQRGTSNIKKAENKDQRHPYQPSYLFEAGIKPLSKYPIKGAIWYQGESNAHNIELHETLFTLLTDSWRQNWDNKTLPIHFVQLSSINRPSWPHFRDSQRELSKKLPYTYMAVSSDLGDPSDVHPTHKREIGQRLAFSALHNTYGRKHITPCGPVFEKMKQENKSLILEFSCAKKLKANGDSLIGFQIAGKDELYINAKTEIIGNKIRVYSENIQEPYFVRYAYTPFTRANLENEEHLPASTFSASLQNKNLNTNNMKTTALKNYPVKGGVSAPFIGVHNNQLIVIGGCNFVEKNSDPVRTFYKDIYGLNLSSDNPEENNWIKLTDFPTEIAYGASVTTPDGIICIGGNTNKGTSEKVHLISYNQAKNNIEVKELPSLKTTVSNSAACLIGRTIYLAGGAINGNTKSAVYTLNLDDLDEGWQEIPTPFQPESQQAVVFSQNNQLFMAGGYNESEAKVFTDVLNFDFNRKQWTPFSQISFDGNNPQAMIGATVLTYGNNSALFVSGVNYDRFRSALQRIQNTQQAEKEGNTALWNELKQAGKEYMSQDPEWYKFRTQLLQLNVVTKEWQSLGNFAELARAGAGIAIHNNKLYVIGGELKPGIRTETANYIDLK